MNFAGSSVSYKSRFLLKIIIIITNNKPTDKIRQFDTQ